MNKQKKTAATELVATLNRQYRAIQRNLKRIHQADEDGTMTFDLLKAGDILDASFEKTLAELKAAGETVKFDDAAGEYFLGAKTFRIQYRVVSVGCVEIEAPTEQIALMKAERLADYDEIDLVMVSGSLKNVTEAV